MIAFEGMTFLIGSNGAGKTAVLQALARLFEFNPSLRRVHRTDFHILRRPDLAGPPIAIDLWLEAQFEFPELKDGSKANATIPGHFAHLQLEFPDGVPRVRVRLEAGLDEYGDVDEQLFYVV
jgi:putative ATP-dependent endonuclease of the OLD family